VVHLFFRGVGTHHFKMKFAFPLLPASTGGSPNAQRAVRVARPLSSDGKRVRLTQTQPLMIC
jgi:hypothetical protein